MHLYRDRDWLYEHYWDKGLGIPQMAILANASDSTILRWLRQFDIPRRSPVETRYSRHTQYRNKEWLEEQYLQKGLTTNQIAASIGVTMCTVSRWLAQFDIPLRPKGAGKHELYRDKVWLEEQYVQKCLSTVQMATLANTSKAVILYQMKQHDIPRRSSAETHNLRYAQYKNKGWLEEQYVKRELSSNQIAALIGTTGGTICEWLEQFGIPRIAGRYELYRDKAWLEELYIRKQLGTTQMAALANTNRSVIRKWMKRHNIPRRTPNETRALLYPYTQYKDKAWLEEQYLQKRQNIYQISDAFGMAPQLIHQWLVKFDIPRRPSHASVWNHDMQLWEQTRTYPLNKRFFDKLSRESAYVIGFIISDGSLRRKRSSWNIVQKDKSILLRIASLLDYFGPLGSTSSGAATLEISSVHMYNVLRKVYGLPSGKKKSYVVQIPDCIIESPYLPDCIRGIFDGDGTVNKSSTTFGFSSGSRALIDQLVGAIAENADIPPPKIKWSPGGYIKKNGSKSGAWYATWGHVLNAISFAHWIYGPILDGYGTGLFLERKRKRFAAACAKWRGKDWLLGQIECHGKTCKDLGLELGVRPPSLSRVLRSVGIYDLPYKNPTWLSSKLKGGASLETIAQQFGVRNDEVKYYIIKYGLLEEKERSK